MNTTYKAWYGKNREALLEKRRLRYHADPIYKAAVQGRSKERRKSMTPVPPSGYVLSFAALAEKLDVSIWTLREWRKKDYFPTPLSFRNKMLFTHHQFNLLSALKIFFDNTGHRVSKANRPILNGMVETIKDNWN